jgi:hypothetical protein
MNKPEYPPEVTDALINAIPENVYDPCPCGCGTKWRFVLKSNETEKHLKQFCDNYLANNKSGV